MLHIIAHNSEKDHTDEIKSLTGIIAHLPEECANRRRLHEGALDVLKGKQDTYNDQRIMSSVPMGSHFGGHWTSSKEYFMYIDVDHILFVTVIIQDGVKNIQSLRLSLHEKMRSKTCDNMLCDVFDSDYNLSLTDHCAAFRYLESNNDSIPTDEDWEIYCFICERLKNQNN